MARTHEKRSYRVTWLAVAAVAAAACTCVPVIHNVAPQRGVAGTQVTITGKYFGATPAANTVRFANTTATQVTVPQSGRIVTAVPAGATTGLVSVTTSDGTGYSKENFVINTDARWTFMVYLDADNNLESEGLNDFMEMAQVGSSADLNIVVQMDRRGGYASGYGDWTDTRRFLVQNTSTPQSAPLQNLGEANMGDPAVLQDFVDWAVTNYPAQRYMLVIWNHGDGWRELRETLLARAARGRAASSAQEAAVTRAVASDDTDNDVLYMHEVKQALEGARAAVKARSGTNVMLDVVGFDACLMGMVEVAYAIQNVANYVVGSENFEPGPGWPYNTILGDLAANLEMTGRDLASVVVTRYHASYPASTGITQSAVDVAKLGDVVASVDTFAAKAQSEWAQMKAARGAVPVYHASYIPNSFWGVDFRTFASEVYNRTSGTDLKSAALALRNSLDAFVVNELHSSDMSGSAGVAVYFPATKAVLDADPDGSAYDDANTFMPVDFVSQHQWDNWLKQYHQNAP